MEFAGVSNESFVLWLIYRSHGTSRMRVVAPQLCLLFLLLERSGCLISTGWWLGIPGKLRRAS
ncbi:MAG TPA: hypothetical protein V6D43_07460 [Candidatus Sericytochromatia bacterium]